MKLESKSWNGYRGPVIHKQKQSSRVLRPNWNAVQWSRVFGINMTSRASRRRYMSSAFAQSGEEEEATWTQRPWDSIAIRLENIRDSKARILLLLLLVVISSSSIMCRRVYLADPGNTRVDETTAVGMLQRVFTKEEIDVVPDVERTDKLRIWAQVTHRFRCRESRIFATQLRSLLKTFNGWHWACLA